MGREVLRRGHHHPGIRADIAAAKRVGELAHPDRHVDPLHDEVDIGVLAIEIDAQAGILAAELDEERGENPAAKPTEVLTRSTPSSRSCFRPISPSASSSSRKIDLHFS